MGVPVIALVGRPNVGKSTLFNRLTRTRDALVADFPGLTRDRQYGFGRIGPRDYLVVDTGGFTGESEGIQAMIDKQASLAVQEADAVLLLVDAPAGRTAADEEIAGRLRRTGRKLHLVLNKAERLEPETASSEFQMMGLGRPIVIAAAHNRGIRELMDRVLAPFLDTGPEADPRVDANAGIRVAIVGRPNVGKSTLVNRLLGEERMLAFDRPGTTRDTVSIPLDRDGVRYTLIDTAGVRRRARVSDVVEKFSVIKTLKAIEEANVVVLMLDARDGVNDQDARLLGFAAESGRALVLAVNKWDHLESEERSRVKQMLSRKLSFLDYASTHFISALHGSGITEVLESVQAAHKAAKRDLSTPQLTRVLQDAVAEHSPPLVRGRRIKLRYAHQGGRNPPVIVIHGSQTEKLPATYVRYLVNTFRKVFRLHGTPIRIELRSGENPYAARSPSRKRRKQG